MKLLHPLRWLLLVLAVALIAAAPAFAGVFISVNFGPPPLLVYDQPPCPGPGLIWTPGYWAYGPDGYYWVPGTWVPAPFVGALWTPGYWGWSDDMYYWHPGYWGYHVGYYGGINYGFGYFGLGFVGGRWRDNDFDYNTAVWRVNNVYVHNTYIDRTVIENHYVVRESHVAYSGGPGGIRHDPDRNERAYMNEQHFQRTSFQDQHVNSAMHDRNAYYNVNHGRPQRIVANRPLAQDNHPAPMQRNTFNNNRQYNQPQNGGRNGYQPNNRGGQNQPYPGNRNNEQGRPQQPQQPQYRTQPEYRTVPPQVQHQQPQNQQQQPQYRQPEYRPAPQQQPQYRPQPQNRPQQQPDYRQQQPQYRPQPQERPQQQPDYRQQQPQYRPQPQERPQQQPQYRPQPQERPQQERPQPQQRPENRGNGGEQQQQQHDNHGRGR